MKFIIGTRGSKLSLAQTNWVVEELKKANPDSDFEIKTIKTKGDTDARPLFTINQKGIFEKEIDRAVAQKEVDFAVHSLKDVPSEIAEGRGSVSPFVLMVLISYSESGFAFFNSFTTQFVCAIESLLPLVPIVYFNSSPILGLHDMHSVHDLGLHWCVHQTEKRLQIEMVQ